MSSDEKKAYMREYGKAYRLLHPEIRVAYELKRKEWRKTPEGKAHTKMMYEKQKEKNKDNPRILSDEQRAKDRDRTKIFKQKFFDTHGEKYDTWYRRNNLEKITKARLRRNKNKPKNAEKPVITQEEIEYKKILKKQKAREYYIKNKDIRNEKRRIYRARLKREGSYLRFKEISRTMLRKALLGKGFTKNKTTEEMLGCSLEYFKCYIESKFESWMNWNNYGAYTGKYNDTWQIDHIIPMASAKTLDDAYALNYYTNLMPLCSRKNLEKRDIKQNIIR